MHAMYVEEKKTQIKDYEKISVKSTVEEDDGTDKDVNKNENEDENIEKDNEVKEGKEVGPKNKRKQ